MKKYTQQFYPKFLKKVKETWLPFIFLLFILLIYLPATAKSKFKAIEKTNKTNSAEIKAIGTCHGITAAEENTYNITITGLNPTVIYHIDLNGDNENDILHFTGATTFTTSSEKQTNISFKDGMAANLVQIDADADGSYDTQITVHEVLCTDADDDGDLDFFEGCNRTIVGEQKGYIVATVAPYNSPHIYVYTLTNQLGNAIAANTTGLFTNLANGTNGTAIDYQVVALNFSTKVDAKDFMNGLSFGTTTGTIVTARSMQSMECSTVCGTMAYDIFCRRDDVALTKKVATTSIANGVKIGDKITFELEIFNQGTAPVFDIVVHDIFQTGYDFFSSDNSQNDFAGASNDLIGGGKVTTLIAGPIASHTSQTIQISLTINSTAHSANLANWAEIIEARETPDGVLIIDEDNDLANQMPTLEGEIDNEITNNATDQDDFDFAKVELTAPIPTLSAWGVLVFGLLVLNLGVWFILRGELV